jgi:hypothetical protein
MTPDALLDKLERLNVKVTINGDKLRLEAPKGVLTPEMKEAIRQYKPALIALLEAQEARRLLEVQGWVVVYSKAIGEAVLWLKHENVVIPTRWRGAVKYTLQELQTLTNNPDLTAEGLKRIHKAKKEFDGKILPASPGKGCSQN